VKDTHKGVCNISCLGSSHPLFASWSLYVSFYVSLYVLYMCPSVSFFCVSLGHVSFLCVSLWRSSICPYVYHYVCPSICCSPPGPYMCLCVCPYVCPCCVLMCFSPLILAYAKQEPLHVSLNVFLFVSLYVFLYVSYVSFATNPRLSQARCARNSRSMVLEGC